MNAREIVERFLALSAGGQRESARSLLSPDVHVVEADSLPFGGTHVGRESFEALERQVFRLFKGTRLEVDRMVCDGDTVVVLATISGTSRRNGVPLRMPIAEIWEVENGQIVGIRPFYLDTKTLLDALVDGTQTDGAVERPER